MKLLRVSLLQHRTMALILVLASLCMKAMMPVGFMPGQNSKILTVQICAEASGDQIVRQLVIPMEDNGGSSSDKHDSKDAGMCHFSSLSMASMSGVAPELLAIALAFILALGFALAQIFLPKRRSFLRPPLRAPPSLT